MAKLCCTLTKQVRDGPHGGRTASVSLEVELDAETVKNPPRLRQHIRYGFDRVREAIDEGLRRHEPTGDLAGAGGVEAPQGNGRTRAARGDRPATASQLRLLRVLAGRKDADLAGLCRERCGKEDVAELALAEASRLIDELGGNREHERR